MRQASFPTPRARPVGSSGAAAVIAGAAMGAPVGWKVACQLPDWLLGRFGGCTPGGIPAGALVGALVALAALPLLGQGTRPGERAAQRPAPTTTTAARLVWLAIAAALGRWLAERLLNPVMGLEGVGWMAILPVVLVAAAGLAMAAEGLVRRRSWARWAAVVAFSLLGVAALAELVDWIEAFVPSRTGGLELVTAEMVAVGLGTPVLFLAVSAGVVVLLLTPATRRDFQSSGQPPAGPSGR